MIARRMRLTLTAALLVATASGCVVGADALNPGFLSALGFDPATVIPPAGRIVVTFNNQTDFPASFTVTVADSATDPTANARLLLTEPLQPNEVQAQVVECPVGLIAPGTVADQQQGGTVAAQVQMADQTVDVAYQGAPLIADDDFRCGDLIEVRLVQVADDQNNVAFQLQVRVLPGR